MNLGYDFKFWIIMSYKRDISFFLIFVEGYGVMFFIKIYVLGDILNWEGGLDVGLLNYVFFLYFKEF